ncbi:MAG: ThiF family adenylyltransferase [Prolixibacteraceae bacterium]|nr:ThiF family adenylyltransferase [Prolixibacteraceae bacterium]
MSLQLISHSPDLKQLRDEGFEIEVKGGYLLIHQIPYVNHIKEIKRGILVSALDLANNNRTSTPSTHVIYFIGDYPCNKDGSPIEGIRNSSNNQKLFEGVEVNHLFSNKPTNGYSDYYKKVTRYAEIISNPAKSIDPTITEKTFKVIVDDAEDSVFQYLDTNSSRANIDFINSKLKGQKVGIIGLGGTGAYILDLVAKTPVLEIHLYDGDDFLLHNAFRSPGAVSQSELNARRTKTDYYASIYSNMHRYVYSHACFISGFNIEELNQLSFVFLCIDRDLVKKEIMEYLLLENIPFIDVGLGVNVVDDSLIGSIRVTTGTLLKNDHLFQRISCGENLENEYASNIQIAELNSLNAVLAVIKWKKLLGFYQDLKLEHNSVYSINASQLTNDECTA